MHNKSLITAGKELGQSAKVLVMLHGRGADAANILGLANHFKLDNFSLVAPQATNFTWYPYSFMAPVSSNEPWLSSALDILNETVKELEEKGYQKKDIYFLGFSQGACLALEYTTRNAARYGGIVAFTGGLIGDQIYDKNYQGDFSGTPVFIGTSDPDPHVPVERVVDSVRIMESMHAAVTYKIYPNMGHTINGDEIQEARKVFQESETYLSSGR
jgi:phospholipase/carboxylesterase